ncbi:MAG: bifunctional folylpolyglutamate synthase/dihydrofolate synthase, partial [Hyphomicrobiaceae bacterium]|nr:bifunctional folylpolyglutamate synthase/dihydrofolate synthase [Hyphomicrobiaceae bacterium]
MNPYKSTVVLEELKKLHPLLIDLSLDRIHLLLERLGRPQDNLPPVIHVAGTNGKGSTIAFLKAIFSSYGKRVHSYTSPHLINFHERIQLASDYGLAQHISDDFLSHILNHVNYVNNRSPITFFEITTAAALVAFAQIPADILLLEVG